MCKLINYDNNLDSFHILIHLLKTYPSILNLTLPILFCMYGSQKNLNF